MSWESDCDGGERVNPREEVERLREMTKKALAEVEVLRRSCQDRLARALQMDWNEHQEALCDLAETAFANREYVSTDAILKRLGL